MLQAVLDASVRRRKLVLLLALLVAIAGAFAARALPIDAVPDITNNQVQINTLSAALSPVEMEKQVTFPVETALAGIPGLEYTRSLSRNGFSQVTAVFDDDVDVYFARTQVSERLAAAREQLPPGVEPRLGATSTGLGEIYMWTVAYSEKKPQRVPRASGWQADGSFLTPSGERLTTGLERAAYLRTVQDWIVRPQMRSVPGVAGVDSIGGFVKQFHVQPDVMSLISYGLTFADVIEALERNNVSTGAGFVDHEGESYLVRASGRIESPREIESIVVGSRAGVPIRISDVATVGIGREARTGSASVNGTEAVVGTALMLIGQNSRTVAAAADVRLGQLQASLPPDVEVRAVLDRTKLVDATVRTVTKNLVEGAILVIAVLLALLGSLRAALVCALAIPLSMLMTSLGMLQAGVSGNLMSLGAIDFGLIVDGSVIIVENCLRRLGERQHALGRGLALAERLEVVTSAAREMVRPSVYGQAIIVTVYVPVLTLTGVEGKLFQPMALTVIFALASAFVLSLTLVPALVAMVMRGEVRERENALVRGARRVYEPLLRQALRARVAWIVASVAAFAGALALGTRLGQEFVPVLDEHDLALHAIRMPSASLESSSALQHEVERTLATFPEVAIVFSKTGTAEMASDPMPPNVSDTFVILRPRAEWSDPDEPKAQLVARLDRALAAVPGSNYEWTQPIQMRFNELIAGVRSDVAVKVFGDEFDAMNPVAERVATVLRGVRGEADVKVEQTQGLPVMNIDVDREAIGRYGLSVAEVHDVVAAAIGGRGAGLVFEGDTRVELVVRLPDAVRQDLTALRELPIPLPPDDDARAPGQDVLVADGPSLRTGFVPLSAVARVTLADGLAQVSRENGKRRVVVQCNVKGRDLGSFVAEARARVGEIALPPGGWIEWGGQFENLVSARVRLAWVVPGCFLIVWLLLYGTFGSRRDAWIVFSGVPLGVTGGVLALWARDLPLSISAAVGFIALSGVAVLNGVVLLSSIKQLRREGHALESAIVTGALSRLRPVLMTALVASLGFVPMALATGTGAEVQRPLATVVIGGLISSTLLTLLVLPALYRAFAKRAEELEPDAV